MKKTRTWTAMFAAAALVLAACGGDDGDDTADTTDTTDTTDDDADDDADDMDDDADADDMDDDADDMGDDDAAADGDWPDEIVLGLVPSQDLDKLVEDADALGELLEAELGISVRSEITEDYTGLVIAMDTGQADIGMFGPIALAQSVDQADATPILQSVRRGTATYHTQWFTNDPDRFCEDEPVEAENAEGYTFLYCNGTDSADVGPVGEEALNNVEEGETIFFVDAASASGYYYPAIQLQNAAGLDTLAGDVDAQFAGGHPNAVLAVLRGDGAIGTSFDDARNVVVDDEPSVAEDLVVFAWSTEIPNDGISVSRDLPEDLVQAITDAFLALAASEEGNAALFEVYEIEDLVPVDMNAVDEARQVAESFG